MQRYKLTLEYDGSTYCGWQKQPGLKSVEQTLIDAFFKLTSLDVEIVGAGRTDAGVHALGQVAHVDLPERYDAETVLRAINSHLRGEAVVLKDVSPVSPTFHARFDARERSYRYIILERAAFPTFQRGHVWHVYRPLNLKHLQEGASFFLGHHDFSSFRASECQAKSPLKTIDKFSVTKEGELVFFDVTARSFLHHQVRNMVGTLKLVGEGKLTPSDIKRILLEKSRAAAGPTAPPQGLFLTRVFYEG